MSTLSASNSPLQIVRYDELIPCRTAFIDAHTPGSNLKENYTIIGGGVSESPDQHVHIKETPGFNIGGAAQPAGCHNSLHSHRTAEVFIIHSGTWRFVWGEDGTDGHVDLDPGDLISLPTHMFRGFENVTAKTDANPDGYAFMFAVLGGDDAGGGVEWAPQVLEDATDHGLILLDNGSLIDTLKGQAIPDDHKPKEQMTPEELAFYSQNTIENEQQVVVRRRNLNLGLNNILGTGEGNAIREVTGFAIDALRLSADMVWEHHCSTDTVVVCVSGAVTGTPSLAGGDTLFIKAGQELSLAAKDGECLLYCVTPTGDPAGPTRYL